MYKCCWNCQNGFAISAITQYDTDFFNANKRFCLAPYPVSERPQNPFKQRFCKQF